MTTSDDEQRVLGAVPKQLYIGGEWRDTADGSAFAVENPATGRTLVNVADGKGADGLAALDAAESAQSAWAATPPRVRGEILRKTYEILFRPGR